MRILILLCCVVFFTSCTSRENLYCLNKNNAWVKCPKGYKPGKKIEYKTIKKQYSMDKR